MENSRGLKAENNPHQKEMPMMVLSKMVIETFCQSVCVQGWTGFFLRFWRAQLRKTALNICVLLTAQGEGTQRCTENWLYWLLCKVAPFLKESQIYYLQHLWKNGCWMALTICLSGNFLMVAFRIQQFWSWLPLFLTQLFSTPFAGYQWYTFKVLSCVSNAQCPQ